jgi:hypothetical protein
MGVALIKQHAKHTCLLTVICGLRAVIFFPHYLINGTIFGKPLFNIKYQFLFSPQSLCKKSLILRRIQWDIAINMKMSLCKVPVIRVNFNKTWILSTDLKKSQMSNFIKTHLAGAELFHADRQTDGRTDMTKLILSFQNFVNAHALMPTVTSLRALKCTCRALTKNFTTHAFHHIQIKRKLRVTLL